MYTLHFSTPTPLSIKISLIKDKKSIIRILLRSGAERDRIKINISPPFLPTDLAEYTDKTKSTFLRSLRLLLTFLYLVKVLRNVEIRKVRSDLKNLKFKQNIRGNI